jgi:hypothetical protein
LLIAASIVAAIRLRGAASSWLKIRNRNYSQWVGREELFERERHTEPDLRGWDDCVQACVVIR